MSDEPQAVDPQVAEPQPEHEPDPAAAVEPPAETLADYLPLLVEAVENLVRGYEHMGANVQSMQPLARLGSAARLALDAFKAKL